MSWTAPATFTTGQVLTAATMNAQLRDNMLWLATAGITGWATYTPTLAQGATNNITKTVTYAKYSQTGKDVRVNVRLDVTGSGTANNPITVSLPVTSATSVSITIGSGYIDDTSANSITAGIAVFPSSATTVALVDATQFVNPATPFLGQTGTAMPAALASGDVVTVHAVYEAA